MTYAPAVLDNLLIVSQANNMYRPEAAAHSGSSYPYSRARRIEDAALIRAAQRGCISSFDALVRRYDQAILRLALRRVGSEQDAQDIYQEAFLKAYKNIAQFRAESSFYTWMHRIVTNLCMDRLRSKQSRERSAIVTNPQGEECNLLEQIPDLHSRSDPERQVLRRELRRHITIALKRLTARERTVFELRHFDELKLRTVGEMLNTSEETVKNTLFRATHKLRAHLKHVQQSSGCQTQARRSGLMSWSGPGISELRCQLP